MSQGEWARGEPAGAGRQPPQSRGWALRREKRTELWEVKILPPRCSELRQVDVVGGDVGP